MYKTHSCGELRATHAAQKVTLAGWVHRRRDHGGVIFIDLRDRYGIVQVTVNPNASKETLEHVANVRMEWVLQVTGTAQSISGAVRVHSLSVSNLDKFRVEPVWTPGLGVVSLSGSVLRNLAPGESRILTFTAQVTERFVRERYREGAPVERMLAFRARGIGPKRWPHAALAFKYWKEEMPVPLEAAPAASLR